MSTDQLAATGEGRESWRIQSSSINGLHAARPLVSRSGTRFAKFPCVIRITTQTEGKRTIVAIDGQVTEADLKAIRRVRNSATGAVVLNLRGLSACVEGGVSLLRTWLAAGANLQAATPFMEMILRDTSSGSPRGRR